MWKRTNPCYHNLCEYKGVLVPDADRIKKVFIKLDANKDGVLSFEEFKVFIVKSLLNQPIDCLIYNIGILKS